MIDERINNSLHELEQELNKVESARKEVERIVSSYSEIKTVTSNYVSSLNAIKKGLDDTVRLIGEDYKNNYIQFEKDRKNIVDSCTNTIQQLSEASTNVSYSVLSHVNMFKKWIIAIFVLEILVFITMLIFHFIK